MAGPPRAHRRSDAKPHINRPLMTWRLKSRVMSKSLCLLASKTRSLALICHAAGNQNTLTRAAPAKAIWASSKSPILAAMHSPPMPPAAVVGAMPPSRGHRHHGRDSISASSQKRNGSLAMPSSRLLLGAPFPVGRTPATSMGEIASANRRARTPLRCPASADVAILAVREISRQCCCRGSSFISAPP